MIGRREFVGAVAASAAAATTHAAPVPVTYTAPAASSAPSPEAAKLKELKSLETQGLITEEQYKKESQKLLNQMVQ